MDDLHKQFVFLVNTVWQRRFHALAVAWLVCAAGWAVVAFMPNIYTSSARLLVDTSNVLRPLLKGIAVESDTESQLDLMTETLTSRANMAAVARLTDLDLKAATPSDMDRLLDSLKARTTVRWEGTKLVSISFSDPDPVQARDVVQALVTTFIETNLGHNRQDMESARQFLDAQIQEYERQLEQAEQRLATFKQERLSQFPNRDDAEARIEELQNQLVEAEAALRKASSQRSALRRQLGTLRHVDRNSRITELEDSLNDLLSRYTEQHPEVVAVRRQIAALQTEGKAGSQGAAGANGTAAKSKRRATQTDSANPVADQLRAELSKHETDIAFYKEQVERTQQRLEKLQDRTAQLPEVEAELTRLNRDYEVIKLKYEEMISRREQARISRERETRADEVELRVVDPPRVPSTADGPSRTILLTVALAFGFGAGGLFAVVFSLLRETYSDAARLREAFGLPVLGSVSNIGSFKEHTRRAARSSAFFAGLIFLFAAYAGLLLVERQIGLANTGSIENVGDSFQGIGSTLKYLKTTFGGLFDRS